MSKNNLKGVCFGEILLDVFSNRKEIGGAPLNVASRLNSLGVKTTLISAVGQDEEGTTLINYFNTIGIDTDTIQVFHDFPTGQVQVALNQQGNASYVINYPSAWDKIRLTDIQLKRVSEADFFVFGSLSARDEISKTTLTTLIDQASYKIFDINLRKPHYSDDTLLTFLKKADLIKLNDEELIEVLALLKLGGATIEAQIKNLSQKTDTPSICVTLGAKGAILYRDNSFYYNRGYKVSVVDTVGSGDSFLAALITKIFSRANAQEAIDFACAVGAIVAKNKGANPVFPESEINDFLNKI